MPRLITRDQYIANKLVRNISEYLNSQHFNHFVGTDEDGDSVITIPAHLKNVPSLILKLYVEKDGKCSLVTRIGTVTIKRSKILEKLNEINDRFSFIKLSVSTSDTIMCITNFFIDEHETGEMAMKYISAVCGICDTISKDLISYIWDEEDYESSVSDLDGESEIDFGEELQEPEEGECDDTDFDLDEYLDEDECCYDEDEYDFGDGEYDDDESEYGDEENYSDEFEFDDEPFSEDEESYINDASEDEELNFEELFEENVSDEDQTDEDSTDEDPSGDESSDETSSGDNPPGPKKDNPFSQSNTKKKSSSTGRKSSTGNNSLKDKKTG